MGLDMCLYICDSKLKLADLKIMNYEVFKHKCKDVMYWRKANQIHNWFVTNVQDGKDDNGYHEVTRDKLLELYQIIEELIVRDKFSITKCKLKLPTKLGFFFGTQKYDLSYRIDLLDTLVQLRPLIYNTDFKKQKIIYHSSW